MEIYCVWCEAKAADTETELLRSGFPESWPSETRHSGLYLGVNRAAHVSPETVAFNVAARTSDLLSTPHRGPGGCIFRRL